MAARAARPLCGGGAAALAKTFLGIARVHVGATRPAAVAVGSWGRTTAATAAIRTDVRHATVPCGRPWLTGARSHAAARAAHTHCRHTRTHVPTYAQTRTHAHARALSTAPVPARAGVCQAFTVRVGSRARRLHSDASREGPEARLDMTYYPLDMAALRRPKEPLILMPVAEGARGGAAQGAKGAAEGAAAAEPGLFAWMSSRFKLSGLGAVIVGNLAYGLSVVEYSVTDMLTLRTFSLLGCVLTCTYMLMQRPILYIPIGWNALFIVMLAIQIVVLLRDRRTIHFNEEEAVLYARSFKDFSFTPSQFQELLRVGGWLSLRPGEVLTTEGEQNTHVVLISSGECAVSVGGHNVATISPGMFVGEIAFMSGIPATATVVAQTPVRCYAWSYERLLRLFDDVPELRQVFRDRLASDLINKFTRRNEVSASTATSQALASYGELLRSVLLPGDVRDAQAATVDGRQRDMLDVYRRVHGIPDADHWRLVGACGWTREEYERGARGGKATAAGAVAGAG